MAKTKEELNNLKQEFETLATKLQELTENELKVVTGGINELTFVGQKQRAYNTDSSNKFVAQGLEVQITELDITNNG